MRKALTTALGAVGALALCSGLAIGAWPYVGGWGIAGAGAVLVLLSEIADRGGKS